MVSVADRMFPPVPRGLPQGTGPEIRSKVWAPGAQPEIASKAVREGIEDRLHDPVAVFEAASGNGGRSLGTLFSSAFLPPFHPAERLFRSIGRMTGRPDHTLLEALAGQDLSALSALYDRYGRVAYTLAYRILGEPEAAEDVVQDAFLSAWRGAGTFKRERGNARSWLLAIVHHRAVDLLRRRTAFRPAPLDAAGDSASDVDTAAEAERNVERGTVRAALETLPDAQRRTIELAYFGGYTQSELAALMGVPLGTVKGRMRIGLQKMRRALGTFR